LTEDRAKSSAKLAQVRREERCLAQHFVREAIDQIRNRKKDGDLPRIKGRDEQEKVQEESPTAPSGPNSRRHLSEKDATFSKFEAADADVIVWGWCRRSAAAYHLAGRPQGKLLEASATPRQALRRWHGRVSAEKWFPFDLRLLSIR